MSFRPSFGSKFNESQHPNAFRNLNRRSSDALWTELARTIARAFYSDEKILLIDFLLIDKYIRAVDLGVQYGEGLAKVFEENLKELVEESFVYIEKVVDEGGPNDYYYINFKEMVRMIEVRRKMLNKQIKDQITLDAEVNWHCQTCKRTMSDDRKKGLLFNKSYEFCCPYCCKRNHRRDCERPAADIPRGTSVPSSFYYVLTRVNTNQQKQKGKIWEEKFKQQFDEGAFNLKSSIDEIFRELGISQLLKKLKNTNIPEDKPSDLRLNHGLGYLGKLEKEEEKGRKRDDHENKVLGNSTFDPNSETNTSKHSDVEFLNVSQVIGAEQIMQKYQRKANKRKRELMLMQKQKRNDKQQNSMKINTVDDYCHWLSHEKDNLEVKIMKYIRGFVDEEAQEKEQEQERDHQSTHNQAENGTKTGFDQIYWKAIYPSSYTEVDLRTLDWGEDIVNDNIVTSSNSGLSLNPSFSQERNLSSYTEDDLLNMNDSQYTGYLARGGMLSLEKINYLASNEYKEGENNFNEKQKGTSHNEA